MLLDGQPVLGWISSIDVDGSKICGFSWIGVDGKASFCTWDEAGVSWLTDHSPIRKSLTQHTWMTMFSASPRYTSRLSVNTISFTVTGLSSLRVSWLSRRGPEVLNGTPHLILRLGHRPNTKDVNLHLLHEHLRE